MATYSVYLPIYISVSIEAESKMDARSKLDTMIGEGLIKDKVDNGWYDIDSNPIIEKED